MPRRWVDERTQALADLVSERGLTMSLRASRVLVVNQVAQVCQQVGVSERAARALVADDALGALADSVAFSLVDEFPGADLHTLARPASMPMAMAGLTSWRWPSPFLLYVDHGPADSIADTPLRELTVLLSLLGPFMAESDEVVVAVPPAFLIRAARKLDTAASHPDATPELTAAFGEAAWRGVGVIALHAWGGGGTYAVTDCDRDDQLLEGRAAFASHLVGSAYVLGEAGRSVRRRPWRTPVGWLRSSRGIIDHAG